MEEIKLSEIGNAKTMIAHPAMAGKIVMFRFEDIFEFYSDEPRSVTVQWEETAGCEHVCPLIMRVIVRGLGGPFCAWCVYADDRHKPKNIVVRKVVWDAESDRAELWNADPDDMDRFLTLWPTMEVADVCLSNNGVERVTHALERFDCAIKSGVPLWDGAGSSWARGDREVLRRYDGGEIQVIWSPIRKNEAIEAAVCAMASELSIIVEEERTKIYHMALNYTMLPEDYKKIRARFD